MKAYILYPNEDGEKVEIFTNFHSMVEYFLKVCKEIFKDAEVVNFSVSEGVMIYEVMLDEEVEEYICEYAVGEMRGRK